MVSDGFDPGQGSLDPYVDSAVEYAQRNGIVIYTIYASGAGLFGHNFPRILLGQNNLSRVAGETGGEAYFQGFHNAISFEPFLTDLAAHLTHQYLLTFAANPERQGAFQKVSVETEVPNAVLITSEKAYVPAASGPR